MWAVLKRFSTRAEAEVVRALLESHGIEARIGAEDGVYPPLGLQFGVSLLVKEEDLPDARRLLFTVQ